MMYDYLTWMGRAFQGPGSGEPVLRVDLRFVIPPPNGKKPVVAGAAFCSLESFYRVSRVVDERA